MLKDKATALASSERAPQRMTYLLALIALLALAIAWVALPQEAAAQGLVRGARHGVHEGNRIAGPVGGVVGGAVGAGVGVVEGALGIPHRRYHHRSHRAHRVHRSHQCRGYRDRHGHLHCS